jgi:hypothetical protein
MRKVVGSFDINVALYINNKDRDDDANYPTFIVPSMKDFTRKNVKSGYRVLDNHKIQSSSLWV